MFSLSKNICVLERALGQLPRHEEPQAQLALELIRNNLQSLATHARWLEEHGVAALPPHSPPFGLELGAPDGASALNWAGQAGQGGVYEQLQ